jgi:hypothetical protein
MNELLIGEPLRVGEGGSPRKAVGKEQFQSYQGVIALQAHEKESQEQVVRE